MTDQPAWVCDTCGMAYGRRVPDIATYHVGACGVCGREASVTSPRDYGWLDMEAVRRDGRVEGLKEGA